MNLSKPSIKIAISGIAFFVSGSTLAASCCGGGASGGVILPKFNQAMWEMSFSQEAYDGSWNQGGDSRPASAGSDLSKNSLTLSYAQRISDNWQISGFIPLVHNQNHYSGGEQTDVTNIGDGQVGVWYETFENVTCVYKVNSWQSLKPSMYLGAALTLPTGVSEYGDRVDNSFETTGNGFYRLDANMLIEKTIYPYSVSWQATYGQHIERPVNEESGKAVTPYDKQLGDRTLHTFSAAYTFFLPNLAMLNTTLSHTRLDQGQTKYDGVKDPSSGSEKQGLGLTLSYSSAVRDWIVKLGISQAQSGKGVDKTTVSNLGVSHVY